MIFEQTPHKLLKRQIEAILSLWLNFSTGGCCPMINSTRNDINDNLSVAAQSSEQARSPPFHLLIRFSQELLHHSAGIDDRTIGTLCPN